MTPEERRAWVARRSVARVRADDRARAKSRQERVVANTREWRRRNPEKLAAHNAVARALRSGKLVKGPCECEGADCNGPVHAHHDDYSKPLEVRWLCGLHHHEHHAAMRRARPALGQAAGVP